MTKEQIINRIKNELNEVREHESLEAFLEARKTWISSSEYFTRIWHLAQEGTAPKRNALGKTERLKKRSLGEPGLFSLKNI